MSHTFWADAERRTSIMVLQTVYRQDEAEAPDTVCDRTGEAGFDALMAEYALWQARQKMAMYNPPSEYSYHPPLVMRDLLT